MDELKNQWVLSVPRILHIYWGGIELNYLRYLTVKTFMKYNPDWQVILWYPELSFKGKSWGLESGHQPTNPRNIKDYFPELLKLPITKSPVDFGALGFHKDFPEVHKADYMRINTLYLYGGAWTDMDVLFFKSMTDLEVNIPENKDKETYVCISPEYGHSTGFNMATEGSRFFGELIKHLNQEYKPGVYQCWGPDIFNKYYNTLDKIPNAVNLGMDVVYAHNCFMVNELIDGTKPRFTKGSIGCHWYAGHPLWGKFYNETRGGETNLPNNIIGNLINNAE